MPKRLLDCLHGIPTDRAPFWFMRQAGRYLPEYRELRASAGDFLTLCLTPELAAEITLQPLRRFAMDAAILFSDILMVPYGLGQPLRFEEGRGPVLEPVDPANLPVYDPHLFHARLAPVYATVSGVRAVLSGDQTLIGFAGSPWTVATYMVEGGSSKDFQKIKRLAYGNPSAFRNLMQLLVEVTVDYLSRQIDAGAEVVQLFDSWAGVLAEDLFDSAVIVPTRAIVTQIKQRYPQVPVIGFPRKAGWFYDTYAERTGVDVIGIDETVPLDVARSFSRPVQGNLDNILLASNLEQALEQARMIRKAWKDKPYIFNLGHGVIPSTPVAHVEALSELLHG